MDIKTRNARQDYGRYMTILSLQSLTEYMSKNNSVIDLYGEHYQQFKILLD